MRVIAVAGGTGPVGKTIVDGLIAHGTYKVYVMSRSAKPFQGPGDLLQVDYTNADETRAAFEKANVDTVICAIGVATQGTNEAQKKLIRAAHAASSVKRFVISSFDMLHRKEDIELNPLTKYTFEAIDELEKTDLEYTRIANGWFLDYYGMPYWKTYLHPWINILSMKEKWAVIPGDGSAKANFITTQDMATFVAHLMDIDQWPRISSIFAQTLSFKELLQQAEKARGSKFEVAYDSLEKLKSGKISFSSKFPAIDFPGGDEAFFATLHYQAGLGRFLVPTDDVLDSRFPHIKPTTVAEVMEKSWANRETDEVERV
ncbi:hypothetical protein B0T10DRAFT_492505 [Thelonectria olida]|uniref:NmrA-like domain-containing protein n=1 Tax=Thelonectria olida TaxID=1576542 RepID=A0A9P8VYR6_9HYPO|nr:hypothetical protein B0T10DRAFT_492505 [Thelonectria olida]